MSKKKYAVMGATGHIGRVVSEKLLAAGQEVRVLSRSEDRVKDLKAKGAAVVIGSLDDPAGLARAFEGADGLFLMIPPDMTGPDYRGFQKKVGEAIVAALKKTNVRHAVFLSSVGAHLSEKTGPILGLHDQEERLNALADLNAVHLRPASFMENLLMLAAPVKTQGLLGSALQAGLKIPMIATRDIADRAATLLLGLDFHGKTTQELLGERDVSMNEVAALLGPAIGKPDLKYVQFPYEGVVAAMTGMGLPKPTADLMIEMYRSFNEGFLRPSETRSKRNTTPTTIEEFVKTVLAPACR
ncbi:MAG TPA: NmrA family NAD(P)-binding protein [bacterium]|nr:NmrA family NAD(P)-binding protein [bacterium]